MSRRLSLCTSHQVIPLEPSTCGSTTIEPCLGRRLATLNLNHLRAVEHIVSSHALLTQLDLGLGSNQGTLCNTRCLLRAYDALRGGATASVATALAFGSHNMQLIAEFNEKTAALSVCGFKPLLSTKQLPALQCCYIAHNVSARHLY